VERYDGYKESGIDWIGKIPCSWRIMRIKHLKNAQVDSFQDGDWIESPFITDKGIRYLTTGNVGDGFFKRQGNGFISEETFVNLNCKYAYPGDLVISRLNEPYGRACILPNDEERYVLAVDIVILRTDNDKRYLCYLMQCNGYQNAVQDAAKGTTMKRISRNNLGNVVLPMAPLPEQKIIADYLDDKCNRIDIIISEAKATIEEYKAWKASIIYEAVTKGLDKNVEMKDSGVEWIGVAPSKWSCPALKNICSMQSGKNLTSEQISDSGLYPVYGGNGIRGYYDLYNTEGEFLTVGRQGALCGNVHKVSGKVWATEHAVVTIPKANVDLLYLYYNLIAMNLNQYASNTAAQPGLAVGVILQKHTTMPSLEEQKAIGLYLDEKCRQIDSLISEKKSLISDLESYKKSLIFETVTGKRKVV